MSSSCSASSDDDDNLELLKEAVDPTFINEYTRKNQQKTAKTSELKSLRKMQDEDDQFNELKVTPEFQRFVARKLVQLLDKKLSSATTITHTPENKTAKQRKINGGVKLLRDSQVYLDIDYVMQQSESVHRKVRIERRRENDDTQISEEEKVREAAVKPESILDKVDIKHWAKLYTKPHFKYKANERGLLVLTDDE